MTKPRPQWLVPIADDAGPARVEIASNGIIDLSLGRAVRPLTPLEAAQLAQALQDASREAAQMATRRRRG